MKKMISWNVNGLRACLGKGFLEYLKETDADIFCIQESKLQEGQVDLDLPGYHHRFVGNTDQCLFAHSFSFNFKVLRPEIRA